MRPMRQPTRYTLERATELGKLMAVTEPRLVPNLKDANEYPGYVEFLLAHRDRLEQHGAFGRWDIRLNALIDAEATTLGFLLNDPDECEEMAIAITAPIRCAFWYGWENVFNLRKRYDQHLADTASQRPQFAAAPASGPSKPPQATRRTVLSMDADDAFWETVANNLLTSLASAGSQTPAQAKDGEPLTDKP